MSRLAGFVGSTIGKKALAALSGSVIAAWVLAHLAGNLSLFAGPGAADAYAERLRNLGPLLWMVRAGLLVAVAVHVFATLSLARRARAARPVSHHARPRRGSTVSSRTLRIGGVLLLMFIVGHVLHLTFGVGIPGFASGHVHANVVTALHPAIVALAYTGAAGLVGLHLFHGLWGAPTSLGIKGDSARRLRRPIVATVVALLSLGFAAVPVAVALGVLR